MQSIRFMLIRVVVVLLPVWIATSAPAAVIATFPTSPRAIVTFGGIFEPLELAGVPLVIDFDNNGTGDAFLVGGEAVGFIDFFVTEGSRAFIRRSRPPNIGGFTANLPYGYRLGATSETGGPAPNWGWYLGWPSPDVAETHGLPRNLNAVFFSGSSSEGPSGEFNDRSGYIGVEFKNGVDTHYGWVHVRNDGGMGAGGYIDAWAYESEPGMDLMTGQVPEVSTPLLMLGSMVGWAATRRRPRNDSAAPADPGERTAPAPGSAWCHLPRA